MIHVLLSIVPYLGLIGLVLGIVSFRRYNRDRRERRLTQLGELVRQAIALHVCKTSFAIMRGRQLADLSINDDDEQARRAFGVLCRQVYSWASKRKLKQSPECLLHAEDLLWELSDALTYPQAYEANDPEHIGIRCSDNFYAIFDLARELGETEETRRFDDAMKFASTVAE